MLGLVFTLSALCGALALALLVSLFRQPAEVPAPRTERGGPLDDDLGDLDEDLAVQLLVLRAHVLGRKLAGTESGLLMSELETAHANLDPVVATHGALRRHAFVALLAAEIDRTQARPSPWRGRAKAVGAAMDGRELLDPCPLYLAVVDATTSRVETGDYRDITRDGTRRVRLDVRAAARALELESGDVDEHHRFVFGDGLERLLDRMLPAEPEKGRSALG